MRYRVHLENTKVPANTKILITDAETPREAVEKVEKSVNPDSNYLLDGTETVYKTTEVYQEVSQSSSTVIRMDRTDLVTADGTPRWRITQVNQDGTEKVLGLQ